MPKSVTLVPVFWWNDIALAMLMNCWKKGWRLNILLNPMWWTLNNYVISNKNNFSIGVSSSSAPVTSC